MNSSLIKTVEIKCRHSTFEESTSDVKEYRTQLQSYPSEIIQSRITFDSLCKKELTTLAPLQLQRLSALKSELISILNDCEDHIILKEL